MIEVLSIIKILIYGINTIAIISISAFWFLALFSFMFHPDKTFEIIENFIKRSNKFEKK